MSSKVNILNLMFLPFILLVCFTFNVLGQNTTSAIYLPSFAEPAIAPDASEIAFASGGDIWTVPASGGEARLLVSHPATESRPVYSPDGRQLAFISTRTGNGDIYILTFETGELKRLTFDDVNDGLDAWSRDGRWIYFSSTSRDIAGMNDIYRVSPEGGTPQLVSADRYTTEYSAVPAPDNHTIAFIARGIAYAQWWRKGHSHLDETEIWTMRVGDPASYERITERAGKELWAMWNEDGSRLYFMSDASGAENIWMREGNRAPQQLTKFTDGRVLYPSISADGKTIVFERNFKLWKFDTRSSRASEIQITRRGAPAGLAVERLRLTDGFQELALSPDGKKIAFTVRGEIFAALASDGGDAVRVTTDPANDSQVTWSPDSRRLAYVSDRDGVSHIFLFDFATSAETQLTNSAGADAEPRFSPDGRMLAFEREGRELRVLNMDSKQERVLATARFERQPLGDDRGFVWSPDSRWIAFMPVTDKLFKNVHIVSVEGGSSEERNGGRLVSFLANVGSNTVSWGADGTYILFNTGQRTESGQLARIDLIPRTPRFREDQFRDLFREETPRTVTPRRPENQPSTQISPQTQPQTSPQTSPPTSPSPQTPAPQSPTAPSTSSSAAPSSLLANDEQSKKTSPKRTEIVFEDIRRRLSLLPVGIDVEYQAVSPDGKWVVMIAVAAGQQNLYLYSLDELAKETPVARQITSTAGAKTDAQFSPDSKEIYYLDQGRINVVAVEARASRPVAVTAEMDVDFAQEKMEVFRQAWSYMRDHFYDPQFHGVDWNARRAEYEPRIRGARTPDEMRRLISLMIGELNASHLGISAPPGAAQPTTGRTGLRFDREEFESHGRLRITEVIPLSPAALGGETKAGMYLLAIDGKEINRATNLDELLNYKINRRVNLTVATTVGGADKREVVIQPTNAQTEKALLYRKWVEENRAYVAKASGGRLGYVHMFDMSAPSLAQLYVDLDAENHRREGVVIDLRNNNGGFVNVYAIDVFARRGYLTMTPRGLTSAPARTVLGQRSLELPTILVTNQHSLSDAEDFTEGYRALRLGKIVGEPTAGWIIYTWNARLKDGSVFRLPRMKVTANDGTNMELSPRRVDTEITRPIGESYLNRDAQLDAAVGELIGQIGKATQR